jgi:hypothetical protein
MNIAVGKVGKSILFDSSKWGAIGGDNEAPALYETLFHKNPHINFYLVGVSDYVRLDKHERNRINKHGNVINIWEKFVEWRTATGSEGAKDRLSYLAHIFESLPKMDYGVFIAGPTGTSNVLGKARNVMTPDKMAQPLDMLSKYAGPIIDFINMTDFPYVLVSNDPRYFPTNARDWYRLPNKVLSQYTETIQQRTWKNYDEAVMKTETVECLYSAMETLFLINKTTGSAIVEKVASLDSFFEADDSAVADPGTKDIKFMIVCNEGAPSRYKDLKKYILDYVEDVDVYGKWNPDTIGEDIRFKGPKKFNDLQAMLPRVKYTFCIPIKKGWVTAKFWEMAHYGIIPFLHPTYDQQNNLKCPEFLRISSSQDLYKKIEFLEKNPDAYDTLVNNIKNMIKPEYYSGDHINNIIMNAYKEITE